MKGVPNEAELCPKLELVPFQVVELDSPTFSVMKKARAVDSVTVSCAESTFVNSAFLYNVKLSESYDISG